MTKVKNKKIIPGGTPQDVHDKETKKNHPRRQPRGKGSDKGIALGEEPLLALLHAGLRPVLEELVVPPDGAEAIVD